MNQATLTFAAARESAERCLTAADATPGATYRLQLNSQFTFADARRTVPYLRALGISDLYLSPVGNARQGSPHGYDVVDSQRLNPEIGSAADFEEFANAAISEGMSIVLDIVPNHMCVADAANQWWQDVLCNGRQSRFATWFDIDWDDVGPDPQANHVLLPILNGTLEQSLGRGEIVITATDDSLALEVQGRKLPLRAESARRIALLAADEPLDQLLTSINTGGRASESGVPLREIINEQHYRLRDWRTAADNINYRRFFDVSDLAGLRVEEPEVFDAVHKLPLSLAAHGYLRGLRVDHIDGLRDPAAYLQRLRRTFNGVRPAGYIVVEKILAAGELLCDDWPVDGTTGYDRLADLEHVLTDEQGALLLRDTFAHFSGTPADFADARYHAKRQMVETVLASELHRLAWRAWQVTATDSRLAETTVHGMARALREVVATFPVYRTYRAQGKALRPCDREYFETALVEARRRNPDLNENEFDALRVIFLETDSANINQHDDWWNVVLRFQQLTGAAMAKGVEDTAFYRTVSLLSLNEVGDAPDAVDARVGTFHRRNREILESWPATMVATSTHDTKRSEDVRARIRALSEVPSEWRQLVEQWHHVNREAWPNDQHDAGRREIEYLLYQTMVGVWPSPWQPARHDDALNARLQKAVEKAIREAKRHTSWRNPAHTFEQGIAHALEIILDGSNTTFLASFNAFLRTVYRPGHWSALSEVALKLTMPGVPDTYQGCEIWNYLLVDPDNRSPVDFQKRIDLLAALDAGNGETEGMLDALAHCPEDDRTKLWLTSRVLRHRQRLADHYHTASYRGLAVRGPRARNVVAFARGDENDTLTIVGRYFVGLMRGDTAPVGVATWRDTQVHVSASPARYRDVITGREIRTTEGDHGAVLSLVDLFSIWPIAVLERLR